MAKAILNGNAVFGNVHLGEGGEDMHNYSTTEHVVGTWIDGSTLYETTVVVPKTDITIDTEVYISHGISNIDTVIGIEGFCKYSSDYLVMPYFSTSQNYWIMLNNINTTTFLLRFNSGFNVSDLGNNIYITLRYTKTV